MTNKTQIEKKNENQDIDKMFKAGVHYAYSKSRRHPSAKPFIFGIKNNVEIFDLEKTDAMLQEAKDYVKTLGKEGKIMLMVGGKNEAREVVRKAAESIDMPYVSGRWRGGTLTNFVEIKKRVQKLEDLSEQREKGQLEKYTKKERLVIDRDIEDLKEGFGGLIPMKKLPDALFVIDSREEKIGVKEAIDMKIPIISLSSSDCDIRLIDHPIPANDSSLASIKYFVSEIVGAYKKGKEEGVSNES